MHYYYPVQISGFWEQMGRNRKRNRIVRNSRISVHPEPEADIRYIPSALTLLVGGQQRDMALLITTIPKSSLFGTKPNLENLQKNLPQNDN